MTPALAAANSTRARLLDAGRAIVEERGYTGAAIAARAGVATGTLYRHFASKEELFVTLFRDACDRELEAMNAACLVLAGAGAAAVVTEILITFARRALRAPRLAYALLAEPVDRLVDAERLEYRRRYAELVAGAVRAGVESGELPPQDPALTAAALVGALAEVLVGPLSPTGTGAVSEERLLAEITAFVTRAIGAVVS